MAEGTNDSVYSCNQLEWCRAHIATRGPKTPPTHHQSMSYRLSPSLVAMYSSFGTHLSPSPMSTLSTQKRISPVPRTHIPFSLPKGRNLIRVVQRWHLLTAIRTLQDPMIRFQNWGGGGRSREGEGHKRRRRRRRGSQRTKEEEEGVETADQRTDI